MTIKQFEEWYLEKRKRYKQSDSWLVYKSKYLLHSMGLDYYNIEELISITVEKMLIDLENIDIKTVDSYAFFVMKNAMLNNIYHHNKKVCCEGDFSEYNIENEEYSEELYHKHVEILQNRVENDDDRLVYNTLISGKMLKTLSFYGLKTTNIVRKLKGLEPIKNKKISRAKGLPKGRPKLNKIKEKKMRTYKGVLKMTEEGKIEKAYASANDVIIDGYTRESVSKCCNGKLKSHKGFIWKFVSYEKG